MFLSVALSVSSLVSSQSSAFSSLLYLLVFKSIFGFLLRLSSISRSSITSYSLSSYLLLSLSTSSFLLKSYLTIYNLYIRYAPFKSLINTISITSFKMSLLRVLPPMTLQNLFIKFALKTSVVILNLPTLNTFGSTFSAISSLRIH